MNSQLTVKKARRFLGKDAKGISDEELEKDIEIAELLKNLFFCSVIQSLEGSKTVSRALPNVP